MKTDAPALILILAAALAAPGPVLAQEPVRSFDQLNTRLKPGDTVYVTDAQGREIKGKIREIGPSSLTLDRGGPQVMQAAAVERVERRSSRKKHALIGLAAGGGVGAVLGIAALDDPESTGAEPLIAAGMLGGIGAGIGALFPVKARVVYRAPGSAGSSQAGVSITPVITPRTKGVAVAFAF
jgi:hypothetical protein